MISFPQITILLTHADQPHTYHAFYSFFLDILLLRAAYHLKEQAPKTELALVLLQVLEKDVRKMLEPGFSVIEVSFKVSLIGATNYLPIVTEKSEDRFFEIYKWKVMLPYSMIEMLS